ncbi:MAG: hypothetical protein ABFS46_03980 [Myxococcota bacterium]
MSDPLQPSLERLVELHRVKPSQPLALLDLVRYAAPDARESHLRALKELGGRIVWGGRVELQFIGPAGDEWDDLLIIEFPSRTALVERMPRARSLEGVLARRLCLAASPGGRTIPRLTHGLRKLLPRLGLGPAPLLPADARGRLIDGESPAAAGLGPSPEQLEAFLSGDTGAPIVMFNLLAYRERAHYDPQVAGGEVSGREAYARYGRGIARLLLGVGAGPIWLGRAEQVLVGEPEAWDQFAVVEYPSRAAFLGMVTHPAYRSQTHHRDAGLQRTELVQCTPWAEFGGR